MFDTIYHLLRPHVLLAYIIPLLISLLGYKFALGGELLFDLRTFVREVLYGTRRSSPTPFSVEKAFLSYSEYVHLSGRELSAMRTSYGRLKYAHKRIGYDLGYPAKLNRLRDAIETNGKITKLIADLARKDFRAALQDGVGGVAGDLSRVKESLKHFVRDWSAEGKVERDKVFLPILDVLKEVDSLRRTTTRVLVPGSGLGRLAWEISELGFQTTANELSFFMNLAFRFLLSEDTTRIPNQHTVQPYAQWFSLQRTNHDLFRSVAFPDVVPRLTERLRLEERDFLSLLPPPSNTDKGHFGYDYVVTLFFIDTSLNVIETIEHIYELLRPGGTWINLGPLLWTSGQCAAVELDVDEVLRLAEIVGFRVDGPRPQEQGQGQGCTSARAEVLPK